ncbi:oligoendopeptidase F [Candidatus Sumerlaeota bacterium]|nr:oligoendopeptidase F [Candidatus Sumerlaeota bacterium]
MSAIKTRDQIDPQDKWDVESIYDAPEKYDEDFEQIDILLKPILELQGQLNTPENVAKVFELEDALGLLLDRLYLYAHLLEDQDTAVGENQARMSKLRTRYAQISGRAAWITPEILQQSEETLKQWLDAPVLKFYRRTMEKLVRRKPHTLSIPEETLLGKAGEVMHLAGEAFGKLCNADLTFDDAVDETGERHPVTNGSYSVLLRSTDRTLRQSAYESMYHTYGCHRNTLATLLSGGVKEHALNTELRKHGSCLEAALFYDDIPTTVYTSLIEAVHEALPVYYKYVELRKKMLGVDALKMYDLYVPITPNFKLEADWPQCREWALEALKPLGAEYVEGAKKAFDERWFDIYENKGKRSGAYSSGAYGQKPLMLLNYHGQLDDVFTTAHELGHSMHTHLSQEAQPYRYAGYPIFLAEIASITNEALLQHFLTQKTGDPAFKAFLLNHLCDSFKGTVFRQTMFAEFELMIHQAAENGEALTADWLCEKYGELNKLYMGPAVEVDEHIALEWSRIPHFFYNFYVFKYATGFVAAQVFAQRARESEETRDRYLSLLKSGGSKDPLDAVRDAGVDLADPSTIKQAFTAFDIAISELTELLG